MFAFLLEAGAIALIVGLTYIDDIPNISIFPKKALKTPLNMEADFVYLFWAISLGF